MAEERKGSLLVGVLYGTLMGVIGGIGLGGAFNDKIKSLQVEQTDNKVSVIRVHRKGLDKICVEDPNSPGNYMLMEDYLKAIPQTADRKIQEAEIKKAARWYE